MQMKVWLYSFTIVILSFDVLAQTGVSINATGAAPDAQTILDVSSTTKGVQLPRMTTAQAATLATTLNTGDDGMIIYDTDLKAFKYWDGSLLQWSQVGTGIGSVNTLDDAYDGGGSGVGRTITADAGNVEIQGAGFLTVGSNVGIGTTTPSEKLEVQFTGRGGILIEGNNTQDVFIQMTNDVAGSNYIYTDQSDGNFLKLESGSGKDIEFLTDGANERMAVQSDGRVRVNNLADPNSAIVISNPAGVLGKVPMTGSGTDVLLGTGVFGPASAFADDDWYQTLSTNTPTSINDWIYTNGRVGIGVGASSNPSAPLHVAAAGAGNPDANAILASNPTNSAGEDAIISARVAGTSAGDPFFSMDVSGEAGWSMGVDNDHANRFKIAPSWSNLSSGTALTIKTDGNVGVGTTDPDQKLQANGIMRSRGSYMIDVDGANGSGPRIAFGSTADVYEYMNLGAYNSMNNLETKSRDFRIGSNTITNALYLQNVSGNIGVSTNAPSNKLTVNGSNSDTDPILGLLSGNNNNGFNNGAQIAFGYNGTNNYQHFIQTRHNSANSQNAIDFYVSNGTASNTLTSGSIHTMSLVSGNVGIGTTAPAQALHVVGTGRYSSLAGTGNRMVQANATGDLVISNDLPSSDSDYIWNQNTVNQGADWRISGQGEATTLVANANGNWYLRGGDDHELRDVNEANTMGLWGRQNAAVGRIKLGSGNNIIRSTDDQTGDYGSAASFDFDDATSPQGILIEGGDSESGGFFANGNTAAIWSPGDGTGGILSVYDEDAMDINNPRMRLNGSGNLGIGIGAPDDKLDVVGNGQVSGYLKVGNPNTASTVKKGKKTFVDGSTINIYNGTGNYDYTWNMGQLDLPPGAANITVKAITYNMTGYRRDTDESIGIYAKIGGNVTGWTLTSSWTFGGGGDQYYDWNFAEENLNWTYSSNQTVQFQLVEENETCLFCNNDYFSLYNIEVTVYYEYTTSPQAGTILAEGRIYANSTIEMGDMAEYFEVVDEDVQTGHLVSLIPGSENQYKLSEKGYDPYILGVVSENPSVVLNSPTVGPPVALAGRVNVKLVPGMPLIKSGDFITSSPQRGLAMKAIKPGTVIGYAVENQQEGSNQVQILLQPGRFYYPLFDNHTDEEPRQKISSGK
jgi:hypothetical protein